MASRRLGSSTTFTASSGIRTTSNGDLEMTSSILTFMSSDHWFPVAGFTHDGHGLFLAKVTRPTLTSGWRRKRNRPQGPLLSISGSGLGFYNGEKRWCDARCARLQAVPKVHLQFSLTLRIFMKTTRRKPACLF